MDKIKVFALGGLDEDGRDCYVVEINSDIFVIEAGTCLPDKNIPGIDFMLPNVDYLIENKNRIKAYIMTHGHDESIGALPYFYNRAPAPIYCTNATKVVIEAITSTLHINVDYDFVLVNATDNLEISGHVIHFFQTCHNFAYSFGVAIETDQGNVVFSGDFVINYDSNDQGYAFDSTALSRISNKPTLLLMAESKAANKPGYCSPHHRITGIISKYFTDMKKRIFITCFYQNLFRIREICLLARKTNKKIYFYNKYTKNVMSEYLMIQPDLILPTDIISRENLLRIPREDVVILMLGSGGELYDEIKLLSEGNNEDRRVLIDDSDVFISAAIGRPSLETMETRAIDSIYRTGATVCWINNKMVSAMHAHEDDLKALLSWLRPKFYMPVRGHFVNMMANAKLALSTGLGFNHFNILLVDNGCELIFDGGTRPIVRPQEVTGIPVSPALVDGLGVATKANEALVEERIKMGIDGVIIIAATIDKEHTQIIAGPDCQMRGFVFVKDAEPLLKTISSYYLEEVNAVFSGINESFDVAINNIIERTSRYVLRETGREPVIMPLIIE